MTFERIEPEQLNLNPFKTMRSGVLVTARHENKVNTMTVGWGGFGSFWGQDVALMAVRPERYTFEFLDQTDCFSVSILPENPGMAAIIDYCGTRSGRDLDKIEACGLSTRQEGPVPYFEEAEIVFLCRKLAKPLIGEEAILPGHGIMERWYGGGFHYLFIGEITGILRRGESGS